VEDQRLEKAYESVQTVAIEILLGRTLVRYIKRGGLWDGEAQSQSAEENRSKVRQGIGIGAPI